MDNLHDDIGIPFSRICRGCLEERQNMQSIFNSNIYDMFTYCTSLLVTQGDGLPCSICVKCVDHVTRLYKFRKLCEKSDSTLKHYVLSGFIPPEEMIFGFNLYDDNLGNGDHFLMPLQQSIEYENTGFLDSPSASLEPECNLVENVLAALQENINIDDTSINTGEVIGNHQNEANDLISYINNNNPCNQTPAELRSGNDNANVIDNEEPQNIHNLEKSLRCLQCFRLFISSYDLSIHMSIHSDKLQCNGCQMEFQKLTFLKRHIKKHLIRTVFICDYCSKEFLGKDLLLKHIKRHDKSERQHICSVCGRRFVYPYDLANHSATHRIEKVFRCTLCPKHFASTKLLRSHLKTHAQEKKYECDICFKRFVRRQTLTSHMRTHTGERPFICNVCGKAFAQTTNLAHHMRSHTKLQPFPCIICGRAFSSSSQLNRHKFIHSDKMFNCTVCQKNFTRPTDLRLHAQTHTNEKLFACAYCDKKFSNSQNRKKHMARHEMDSYKCSICKMDFATDYQLKQHLKGYSDSQIEANFLFAK